MITYATFGVVLGGLAVLAGGRGGFGPDGKRKITGFYRRALAVSLQPLRHTGARDEAVRLIRRDILQQVLVEALG